MSLMGPSVIGGAQRWDFVLLMEESLRNVLDWGWKNEGRVV